MNIKHAAAVLATPLALTGLIAARTAAAQAAPPGCPRAYVADGTRSLIQISYAHHDSVGFVVVRSAQCNHHHGRQWGLPRRLELYLNHGDLHRPLPRYTRLWLN